MRIGIDIDGVITNFEQYVLDYFSKYCVENNIEYNIKEMHYLTEKTFNVSSNITDEFWKVFLEHYAINEEPRRFAGEVIKKLKQEGNEIYIITARWTTNRDDEIGEKMRNIVKDWLSKYDIVYDKLIFSKGNNEEKEQELIDNKIDLMIEDNPNNIMQLSKIVPIICYHTQYNRHSLGDNITRCYSWYDIYNKIKDKK